MGVGGNQGVYFWNMDGGGVLYKLSKYIWKGID